MYKSLTSSWWQWAVLATLSVAAFLSLAMPQWLPIVDLPQHARMLRLILDGPGSTSLPSGVFEYNHFSPYWTFHIVATPLTAFLGPVKAVQITVAFFVAVLPLASGFWLVSAGKSPILGVFSALVMFGDVTAWGLVGMTTGLPLLVFILGLTERMVLRPKKITASLIAILLLATVYSHVFLWIIAVGSSWFVNLLGQNKRFSISNLILVLGTLISASVAMTFYVTLRPTPLLEMWMQNSDFLSFDLSRLKFLVHLHAMYGPLDHRVPLVTALLAVLAIRLLLAILDHKKNPKIAGPENVSLLKRLFAWRYAILLCPIAIGYMIGPQAFFFFKRCGFVAFAFVPILVSIPKSKRWLPFCLVAEISAAVLAFGITWDAARSGFSFADQNRCISKIVEWIEPDSSVFGLVTNPAPFGYALPVGHHISAYAVAEKGGIAGFDFVDNGVGPVRYAKGSGRVDVRDAQVHLWPQKFSKESAARYDVLFSLPPRARTLLESDQNRFNKERRCGPFQLLIRSHDKNSEKGAIYNVKK